MAIEFGKRVGEKVKFRESDRGKAPIDLLAPKSERHDAVLKYLLERLKASERAMSTRYSRWRLNETQFQAYINLQDHERYLKEARQNKGMPEITSLVVPYSYSTVMSVVTYLLQVFAGSNPIFRVNSVKTDSMQVQEWVELAMGRNCDHVRMVLKIFQFLLDAQIYNLGVLRNLWSVEERYTTIKRAPLMPSPMGMMPNMSAPKEKVRERRVMFEGTGVTNIDPFMFFPDPRVSPTEVSRKGEFVFWRDYTGMHILKEQEQRGLLKYIDEIGDPPPANSNSEADGDIPKSNRNMGSSGEQSWRFKDREGALQRYAQIDQGSVIIIPNKLGIGDSDEPEKWLFTVANKKQIIQCEPLDLDHGMHPIAVTKPYSMGYAPGGQSMAEMLEPIQSGMSWMLNSHIANVRAVINNSFVLDPNAIDMTSFKDGRPGRLIRLKPSAIGRDIKTVIQQLQLSDVTQQHVGDIEVLRRIGDMISAVNDNVRGLQQTGGRKTATEVRTALESGASRLVMQARVISGQAMVDQAEQICINMQQLTTEPFMLQVVGEDGAQKLQQISPEQLVGDFSFPVTDGTLPLDKIAILDVWKEIFMNVSQNPMLQQMYSVDKIFEFVCELSGARNINKFKMQPGMAGMQGLPPEALMQQHQAGNVVPLMQPPAGPPGAPGGRGIPDFGAMAG